MFPCFISLAFLFLSPRCTGPAKIRQNTEYFIIKVLGALNIKKSLTDDEIDFVYSLLEGEKYCRHFNQFGVPKNFWMDVLKHDEETRKERPEQFDKMAAMALP